MHRRIAAAAAWILAIFFVVILPLAAYALLAYRLVLGPEHIERRPGRTSVREMKLRSLTSTSTGPPMSSAVSPRTVETHRARICLKLNLQGSHALMRFAVQYKSLL